MVKFLIGCFFLVRDAGETLDFFGKYGIQVVILRVLDKCTALVNDAVDGGIAHKGSVFGFLFFEGEDAFKVGVHGGEHFQVVLDIVFFAEGVFGEKNGKLRLGAEGRT